MDKSNLCLRICNFELSTILSDPLSDLITLNAEACSTIYASPMVLREFENSNKGDSGSSCGNTQILYNPFVEDVFSLGLTIF